MQAAAFFPALYVDVEHAFIAPIGSGGRSAAPSPGAQELEPEFSPRTSIKYLAATSVSSRYALQQILT